MNLAIAKVPGLDKSIWASTYALTQGSAIENDTLSYHKVPNDFQYKVNHLSNLTAKGNIAKGSFGAAFGEGSPENRDESDSEKKGKGKGRGKDKSNADSNPNNDEKQEAGQKRPYQRSTKVCIGCGGRNWCQDCLYRFPEKAPKNWKPNPKIQAFVKTNLEEDPNIIKEATMRSKRSMYFRNKPALNDKPS